MDIHSDVAAALWVNHVQKHGVSCQLIDETTKMTRNSTWEAILRPRMLKLKDSGVCVGQFIEIPFVDLKGIEKAMLMPNFPKILHEGGAGVVTRVVALKYQWTRRSCTTNHCTFVLFPTIVDTEMVLLGIASIIRDGLKNVKKRAEAHRQNQSKNYIAPHLVGRAKELQKRMEKDLMKGSKKDKNKAMDIAAGPPLSEKSEEESTADENAHMFLPPESPCLHKRWLDSFQWDDEETKNVALLTSVPLKYRFKLWPEWLHADGLEEPEMATECDNDSAHQINLDLHRTFPEHLSEDQRELLKHVLVAYAAYNPAIGYCQSMNMIAAIFLIMGFEPTVTYKMFIYLLDNIMDKFHAPDLGGLLRDVAVLEVLLATHYSLVSHELECAMTPLLWVVSESFLTLCTKDWPLYRSIHFWDIIFAYGTPAFFCIQMVIMATFFPKVSPSEDEQENDMQETKGPPKKKRPIDPVEVLGNFRAGAIKGLKRDATMDMIVKEVKELLKDVTLEHIQEIRAQIAAPN